MPPCNHWYGRLFVANQSTNSEEGDLRTLLGGIVRDSKQLISQQFDLLRAEVGQELKEAGTAVAECAGGGGLAAAGGLLSGFALAHLIHDVTRLPMWVCYGLAAGGLSAAGVAMLRAGREGFANLRPLPQTTEALGENLEWLKDRLIPASK